MCELPKYPNKDILIGFDSSDDACVYRVSDDVAIVQTVDFFPPMVDDPYLFGQIAAANAISDVYAMGGKPIFALNLLCFPNCLDLEVAGEILAGGADKAAEAMCTIAGGHSITDDEPKYGMCVTGTVHPKKVLANNSPRQGDAVVITKALGTGILTTAFKGEFIGEDDLKPATDAMRQLNRYAAEAAEGLRVHACTDITGFGFAGHLCEMMEGSGMTAQIAAQKLPLPQPGSFCREAGSLRRQPGLRRHHGRPPDLGRPDVLRGRERRGGAAAPSEGRGRDCGPGRLDICFRRGVGQSKGAMTARTDWRCSYVSYGVAFFTFYT